MYSYSILIFPQGQALSSVWVCRMERENGERKYCKKRMPGLARDQAQAEAYAAGGGPREFVV